MYYGYLGTNHKGPDYQGVLIFLYFEAPLGTVTVDFAGVLISSVLMNRFHCMNNLKVDAYNLLML